MPSATPICSYALELRLDSALGALGLVLDALEGVDLGVGRRRVRQQLGEEDFEVLVCPTRRALARVLRAVGKLAPWRVA